MSVAVSISLAYVATFSATCLPLSSRSPRASATRVMKRTCSVLLTTVVGVMSCSMLYAR